MPRGVAAPLCFDVEAVTADQGKSHVPVPRSENARVEHASHCVECLPPPGPGASSRSWRKPERELVIIRNGKAVLFLLGAAFQPIGANRFEFALMCKIPSDGRI